MLHVTHPGAGGNSILRLFRTRLVYAGYVTVRLQNGQRRSISVLRRRKVATAAVRGVR